MDPLQLKQFLLTVLHVDADEIGCESCSSEIERFVELYLDNLNAAEAMPRLQAHLEHCNECREEFQALLLALRAVQ